MKIRTIAVNATVTDVSTSAMFSANIMDGAEIRVVAIATPKGMAPKAYSSAFRMSTMSAPNSRLTMKTVKMWRISSESGSGKFHTNAIT